MNKAPIEWMAILGLVVVTDVYYYKSKRRHTLSHTIKQVHRDPVLKSLSWAFWTWLTFHLFFEKMDIG